MKMNAFDGERITDQDGRRIEINIEKPKSWSMVIKDFTISKKEGYLRSLHAKDLLDLWNKHCNIHDTKIHFKFCKATVDRMVNELMKKDIPIPEIGEC